MGPRGGERGGERLLMSGYVENGPTLVHVGGSLGMIHSESLLDGKWCKVSRYHFRIYDFDCSAKLVDHQFVVVYAGCMRVCCPETRAALAIVWSPGSSPISVCG